VVHSFSEGTSWQTRVPSTSIAADTHPHKRELRFGTEAKRTHRLSPDQPISGELEFEAVNKPNLQDRFENFSQLEAL
jgi:hypothetical protein